MTTKAYHRHSILITFGRRDFYAAFRGWDVLNRTLDIQYIAIASSHPRFRTFAIRCRSRWTMALPIRYWRHHELIREHSTTDNAVIVMKEFRYGNRWSRTYSILNGITE